MNLTERKDIIIPDNRIRRDFDPLYILDLQRSILEKGLMSPVLLRNDGKTLVAGEQRLQALTELHRQGRAFKCDGLVIPRDAIPYVTLSELTPLQLREAEYEENCIRRDLSWQERSSALAQLHLLRAEQKKPEGKIQTLVATASEARLVNRALVSDALLIEKFKADPDVMGAKTAKEAVNIARKKVTADVNAALARDFGIQAAAASPHKAVLGDFTQIVIEGAPFDIILADPPYGINAHKMAPLSGSQAGTEHTYEDTPENAKALWEHILTLNQICKPQAALYMFCDFRHFWFLHTRATANGWTPWPTPIIGIKPSGGMIGDSAHGPRKSYECVFFAYKGDKRTTGVYLDHFIMEQTDTTLYAAAKPVSSYVNLLRRSTIPGMSVLDPCMGSGTIFPAANLLSLRATGIEIDEAPYNLALTRIQGKV